MGGMADRYCTGDGWSVEVVRLTCTPERHDGEWLRIRHLGYYIRDTRNIEGLEQYVSLADLRADALAGRRPLPPIRGPRPGGRWLFRLPPRLPPPAPPRPPGRGAGGGGGGRWG